ncbi:hypothetical protein BXO88_11170 [Oribacterium sp. C9]|uniref:hypothetical protein n=1 Tax=Oribacterium sp. C9 TaxID=1943579 RepID=UPI00098EED8A|nr:hypothetical protein [Oribacterium sp. C9]OON85642.1 hypothetical protein BXO88_11170 [Oribacterium sp. C9]
MRRRFFKTAAAILSLSVAVSMCSVTAFADEPNEKVNSEQIEGENNTDYDRNEASIATNNAEIGTNNSTITTNNGDITTNNGTVGTNNGDITSNVEHGTVQSNHGTIGTNSAEATKNEQSDSEQIQAINETTEESGGVMYNHGTINVNSGFVQFNGVNEYSDLLAIPETPQEETTAIIKNNTGTVYNNGDFVQDGSDQNAIVINYEGGFVTMNNGIVENYSGGKVGHNNGTVYNYGGIIVEDGGEGTEYFSVTVSAGDGLTTDYSNDGFTKYNDARWLGKSYVPEQESLKVVRESSTVTVTPKSGYEISSFSIPDKYSKYVSATKNSDGSWTLTVTSGMNIELSPIATRMGGVYVDVSVNSDHDDDGGRPTTSDRSAPVMNEIPAALTVNSVDFGGQGLEAPLSEVLTPIDNLSAINNFSAAGAQLLSTENMMACGVVDFKNAFVNSATGSVDVPVTANVVEGQTYTVALSDGTTIQVTCTANGILNIPFAANAQNLTFIIYGLQANPTMMMAGDGIAQFQDALAGLTP